MEVRGLAVQLTNAGWGTAGRLAQKDFSGEAKRLFLFVQHQIRYLKDIDGVETLHPASWILQQGAGDCDDKAILLAALLLSIGHTPRFIAVAFQPGEFSHVWVQDWLGFRWVDLETTENVPFGRAVPLDGSAKVISLDV